jgi:hypothetical protein
VPDVQVVVGPRAPTSLKAAAEDHAVLGIVPKK